MFWTITGPAPCERGKLPVKTRFQLGAYALVCAVLAAAIVPAQAEDKVLATVNGVPITSADVRFAEAEIGDQLRPDMQPAMRLRVLVEYLIEHQLFAEAAKGEKLGKGAEHDKRVHYYNRRVLRDAYFDARVRSAVSEAEAKKVYDGIPRDQVRARHILVKTLPDAKDVIERLNRGEEFATLAKEKSLDTSNKDSGGDLGFFGRGQMVPSFEAAVFKLKDGEISEPVKTQFGFHIIKLEQRRKIPVPPYDVVKDRIMTRLMHRKAKVLASQLRRSAKIIMLDPELKKPIAAPRGSGAFPPQ